ANHAATTASAEFTISQATPSITFSPPASMTYDGNAHTVSAEAYAADGTDLGSAAVTYNSGAAPVNVGSYTATASIAGNSNYAAASATTTITANPQVSTSSGGGSGGTSGGAAATALDYKPAGQDAGMAHGFALANPGD